jgi:tetratricopeptide (TPR) repeat protein
LLNFKIFITNIIFFLLTVTALGQKVELTERCKEAYSQIIKLKLDTAQKILDEERNTGHGNLYVDYLENYIDFLNLFITENKSLYDHITYKKSERIDKLNNLPDSDTLRDYLIANVRLQWAMVESKFRDYFSSAVDIRKAYLGIERNIERFPGFEQQYITMGVLHIIVGMVPDKYSWFLSLLSMKGSVTQGVDELYSALEFCDNDSSFSFLKPEILFYIAFTEMNLGLDDNKKMELLNELKPFSNDNLLLGFLRANMLMRSGFNDEAFNLLERLTSFNGYLPFYYLYYLKAEIQIRRLDLNAKNNYGNFINNFTGKNYLKDAERKIAWCFLLEGDTLNYFKKIKRVIDIGDDFVGVDKDAEKEARSGIVPNIILLKARLLFDGGYYNKAKNLLLTDINGFKDDDIIERYYRLGRIAQKSGDIDEAKLYLKKTIETGKNSTRYFAGNAALQLGIIYEKENNFEKAKHYYNICRTLDFDEYETSIKEKAKQGLERVGE